MQVFEKTRCMYYRSNEWTLTMKLPGCILINPLLVAVLRGDDTEVLGILRAATEIMPAVCTLYVFPLHSVCTLLRAHTRFILSE